MVERIGLALETHAHDMDIFLGYLSGFRSMLVLSAAGELKLFDKVGQSPDGVTAAKLAEDNGWDENTTRRLLDACAALKTVKKAVAPNEKAIYKLDGPGWYMQKNSKISVWEMATIWTKRTVKASAKIPDAVRRGHGNQDSEDENQEHDEQDDPLMDHKRFNDNLDLARVVQREGFMQPYVKGMLRAFDLSKFKTVVDVGGGSGTLTFELCRLYPSMSVIYFDQAKFSSVVTEHLIPKEENLNVSFQTGNYFEDELPAADLYLMPKNLYAWEPEQLPKLIQKVSKASNSGSGIVLFAKTMNDTKDGPIQPHVWDVIAMADSGGLQRSGEEYGGMLRAAGYNDVKVAVTSEHSPYDVVFATKS